MADIKFSEFPKATTSKDSDEIAILQDGVNKMIPSPVLESKIINKTVSRVIEQEPIGVVEEGNANAVSGGNVFNSIKNVFSDAIGFNKFPKEFPYKENSYVDYLTGNIYETNEFSVFKIPVQDLVEYSIRYSHQMAFFDENENFLSGFYAYPGEIVTVSFPENTTYILLSVLNTLTSAQMVVKGRYTLDSYIEPLYGNMNVYVSSNNIINDTNYLVVGKGMDFESPLEALNKIKDDSVNKRYVLYIMPGEYVGSLQLIGRYITLIGSDKYSCHISTYTNDYYNPPIDLGPNSNVYNLTIIASTNSETPPNGVDNLPAYGVHFDLASRFDVDLAKNKGRAVLQNCRIISNHQHAIGIGLTPFSDLTIENCEIYSPVTSAFRAHNYMHTGTNQSMKVVNCEVYNSGNFAPIVLQDTNNGVGNMDNIDTVFTFQKCVAYNDLLNQGDGLIDVSYLPPIGNGTIAGKIIKGKGWIANNFN